MNDCVFCDRNRTSDIYKNLIEEQIIFENDDFCFVAQPGQITDGGTSMILPKAHIPCMGALDYKKTGVAVALLNQACHATALEYQPGQQQTPHPVTIWEHGIAGQTVKHAHLHLFPVTLDLTPRIRADFPTVEFGELQDFARLSQLYRKHSKPYLFWSTPKGKQMVCWNPSGVPSAYLRMVLAELLGRPERANWRGVDRELDKRLWQETVTRLKPYFT